MEKFLWCLAILKNMTSQTTLGHHFWGGLWAQGLSYKRDICIKYVLYFMQAWNLRVVLNSNILANYIQNIRLHETRQKTSLLFYNTKYNFLNNQYISQLAVESSSALNECVVFFFEKCIESCILAFSILCLILKQSQTEIKITSKNSLVRLTNVSDHIFDVSLSTHNLFS